MKTIIATLILLTLVTIIIFTIIKFLNQRKLSYHKVTPNIYESESSSYSVIIEKQEILPSIKDKPIIDNSSNQKKNIKINWLGVVIVGVIGVIAYNSYGKKEKVKENVVIKDNFIA